jgi:hypothetical protein
MVEAPLPMPNNLQKVKQINQYYVQDNLNIIVSAIYLYTILSISCMKTFNICTKYIKT